jgi:rhodanese-related sulfurtransferase
MKNLLALLLLLFQLTVAQAMRLEVVGNQVFAEGSVGGNDFNQIQGAFDNPKIDTVVFVNSPGGDLWTGLMIGYLIAEKKYKTVVAGSCMSACSLMFIAGRERRFGDAFRPNQNVVGIHGAANSKMKQVIRAKQQELFDFYKNMIGEKFNARVINQALYFMDDTSGMLYIPETARAPQAVVYQCPSAQTPRAKCTYFKEENALTLGMLTHEDLVVIELPAAFKPVPMLLGKPLDRLFESLPAYLERVATRQCVTDACKTSVQKWGGLKENRTLATRQSGAGLGWSSNSENTIISVVSAVYGCNHARGLPVGLCQVEAVNNFDVRGMYQQSEREHKDTLANLKIPVNRFYGNEELGNESARVEGFKTQRYSEMTPAVIEGGVITVHTQDLARMLMSEKPPTVIEVGGGTNEVIPTSKAIINGGLAFENPAEDGIYSKRFTALLELLAADKTKPIIFYCEGRECWLAVNAALRAKAAGYTQVLWYRGGFSAWKAARLPTALIAVTAVAN